MTQPFRRKQPLLGTFVEVGIFSQPDDDADFLYQATQSAFQRIAHIQQLLSFHDINSELNQINQQPMQWHTVQADTLRVLTLAKRIGLISSDKFNCTVGGEMVARGGLPRLFDHEVKSMGSAKDIQIKHGKVKLNKPLLLTLDGIGKGYAVDMAVAQLKQVGVMSGWVNAGGDLRHFGHTHMAVYLGADTIRRKVTLHNAALATSRLSLEYDSDHPALLILPENALGTENRQDDSLSVMASCAWRCDALTKVLAATPLNQRQATAMGFKAALV
ncbi:FAD:protein FMN transferase [Alteromonadaceae bacterium BrNp21-10]|nr:FAD:protein FMN transferase [Alteromonadaceae bacterium BrNp21-10]